MLMGFGYVWATCHEAWRSRTTTRGLKLAWGIIDKAKEKTKLEDHQAVDRWSDGPGCEDCESAPMHTERECCFAGLIMLGRRHSVSDETAVARCRSLSLA